MKRDDKLQEIKNLLQLNPHGLTIEEVAQQLILNRATAAKYLNSLVLSGQAHMRELGRAKLFSLDKRLPLTDIINLLSDPMLILDDDQVVLNVNDALLAHFSISRESLSKKRLDQSLLNSFISPEFYLHLKNALKGNGSIREICLGRDDRSRYFRTQFIPLVFDGGGQGAGIVFEDITEARRRQIDLEECVRERTEELSATNAQLREKIGENRRTLAALRESERKYRRMIETANEAIWVIDPSGTITFANGKSAECLRYATPKSIIGRNITDYIFPEDLPEHFRQLACRIKGEKGSFERRFRCSDGKGCWMLVSVTPVMGSGGEFCGSFAMMTDVTAQKELEQKLEEKSRYYELLLQTSTDAIHIIDKKGCLQEWNAAFLSHLGYSAAEAVSLNATDWDRTENPEHIRQIITSAEGDGGIRFETRHKRKDGSIRDVEIVATRICINGERMLYASARDITDRKQMDRALRESEERCLQLVELGGAWIWEVDPTGRFRYSSPIVKKILGYEPEEIVGRMHYYDLFSPDKRISLKSAILRIFRTQKPFHAFISETVHKDGNRVLLETCGLPFFSQTGEFMGYRGGNIELPQ